MQRKSANTNDKLNRRMNEWMRGRNGADALANAAVWVAVLLCIINFFAGWPSPRSPIPGGA